MEGYRKGASLFAGALLGGSFLGIRKVMERRAQGTDMSVALGTLRDSCECKAWASLRHTYLGSFILEPGAVRELSIGVIWCFGKRTGLL
jgi:hypothetical protein